MKKPNLLFVALTLVTLLGAGCTSTNTSTTPSPDIDDQQEAEEGEELDVDGDTDGDTEEDLEKDEEETIPAAVAPATKTTTEALNVTMSSGNFFFKPDTITAKAGQTVNITFSDNEGYHTIVIDEIDFKKTVTAGETISFTAPTKPGSYPFICDVGKHAAMGMTGTLIVE